MLVTDQCESSRERIRWIGRDFWRASGPTPCLWHEQLRSTSAAWQQETRQTVLRVFYQLVR